MDRILDGIVWLFRAVLIFAKNLRYSLINYLRSKTLTIPNPAPRGARAVIDSVMGRPRFQEYLAQYAREKGSAPEQVLSETRSTLEEIAADINYLTTPFWDFFLTWILNTIYEGLVIDEKKLEEIRVLAGKKPVVFVPNHRSHMDYLLLSYLFYRHRIPLPHCAAGSNLAFWPLGVLFRKSGAFFIRRSYEGNKLYAAAVQAYIEELLRENSVMQFFIEGTRSRTGKLLPPKMGILSAMVQSYYNGAVDEVLFVPTTLTYESVLEEKSYLAEQGGATKAGERPLDLVRIAKYLRKRSGKIYVQFGETISLKEWLTGTKPEEKRSRVEELAFHLTYQINKTFVVTPGSLVASVLLSHPKRVMAASELAAKVEPLTDYLRYKGCRISEPLNRYPVASLKEAVNDACERGFIEELRDEEGVFYLLREEKRPLLDYYKNNSVHFFVSLAVLCGLLEREPHGKIGLQPLEEVYRFIQTLFRYEFTFSRRQPLREHIGKLLEYLQQKGVISVQDGVIELEPNQRKYLGQFSSLIRNFREGYYTLWKSLPSLGVRRWEQKELMKWLLHKGHIFYLKDQIRHREAISRFMLQNAIWSFRDLGLLRQETDGWGKKCRVFYRRNAEVSEGLKRRMELLIPTQTL